MRSDRRLPAIRVVRLADDAYGRVESTQTEGRHPASDLVADHGDENDGGEEASPESQRQPSGHRRSLAQGLVDPLSVESEPEFPEEEPESQIFTRDQRRSRRKRAIRARTINTARFPKSALEVGRLLQPEVEVQRPQSRAECASVPRPCPFVSCRYHLYLDVSSRTGSIKLNFPDLEVWEMNRSCALDVADKGPLGAEELGEVMNLTRERIRQLQETGLAVLSERLEATKFNDEK